MKTNSSFRYVYVLSSTQLFAIKYEEKISLTFNTFYFPIFSIRSKIIWITFGTGIRMLFQFMVDRNIHCGNTGCGVFKRGVQN